MQELYDRENSLLARHRSAIWRVLLQSLDTCLRSPTELELGGCRLLFGHVTNHRQLEHLPLVSLRVMARAKPRELYLRFDLCAAWGSRESFST